MDIDLGPLNVLICWQTILLSLTVATATHGVKRVIDHTIEGGKVARQQKIFVNRIVLPGTPILLGAVLAIFVPMHPEALLTYIADHQLTGFKYYAIMAAYGSCLGQFSDYIWHRFSGIMDDVKKRRGSKKAAADDQAPVEPPSEPPAPPAA